MYLDKAITVQVFDDHCKLTKLLLIGQPTIWA